MGLTALPTLSPFVRDANSDESGAEVDDQEEMVAFLKREKVDIVVACDMSRKEIVSLFPDDTGSRHE